MIIIEYQSHNYLIISLQSMIASVVMHVNARTFEDIPQDGDREHNAVSVHFSFIKKRDVMIVS